MDCHAGEEVGGLPWVLSPLRGRVHGESRRNVFDGHASKKAG